MWARLRNKFRFLRRREFDHELKEEMDFHREMLALEKARQGLPLEAAEQEAWPSTEQDIGRPTTTRDARSASRRSSG